MKQCLKSFKSIIVSLSFALIFANVTSCSNSISSDDVAELTAKGSSTSAVEQTTTGEEKNYPQGFVFVEGSTVIGDDRFADSKSTSLNRNANNYGVFQQGRTLEIKDFLICDHEVTQAEYSKYCTLITTDAKGKSYGVGDEFPAYYVTWYSAIVYCNKRSIDEDLTPVYTIKNSKNPDDWGATPTKNNATWNAVTCDWDADGYRLPTECEWEYAARGGKDGILGEQTDYAGSNVDVEVAHIRPHGYSSPNLLSTQEVKGLLPNSLNIYDMSGNVSEWCWDLYASDLTSCDVTGPNAGTYRMLKGGSCNDPYNYCIIPKRRYSYSYTNNVGFGFRVVRSNIN